MWFAQVITGISYATYASDVPLHSNTLIATIALQMNGVTPSDIKYFVAASSSASSASSLTIRSVRGVQTADSISISYTVSVDSAYSVASLASQLQSATENGKFDASLHAQALTAGATGLQSASTDRAVVTYPPASSPAARTDNKLSSGAIAGVVIGVLAGVALMATLLKRFLFLSRHDGLLQNCDNDEDLTSF